MATIKRATAPDKQIVETRFDATVRPLGMHPDVHAAGMDPRMFVYLQNTRFSGSDVIGRGGQSLLADLGDHAITGLVDFQLGKKFRLYLVGDGCPGVSPTSGQYIGNYTLEQNPRFQRPIYKPSATSVHGNKFKREAGLDGLTPPVNGLFFSIDNKLYRFQSISSDYYTDALSSANGTMEKLIWTAPAAYDSISAFIQHGSELLVAVVGATGGGAGNSAIYRWNGVTWRLDLSGINPVTGFAAFRDVVVAGFGGAPNHIRVRAADGTWSTVAAPGPEVVSIGGANRCESFEDGLFIPSGENVFRFDGSALTLFAPATTLVTAGATIHSFKKAFGYLYATWSSPAPEAKLLRYDSSTWLPAHFDFHAQNANTREARSLEVFEGCLMAAFTVQSGLASIIFQSQRDDTTLAWEETSLGTADVSEMFVF